MTERNEMNFTKNLDKLLDLIKNDNYIESMTLCEELIKEYPGNAKLLVLHSQLIQIQEKSTYELNDAREALIKAMDFGDTGAIIEYAYFLNAVENAPNIALRHVEIAIGSIRELLMNAFKIKMDLLEQLGKKEELIRFIDLLEKLAEGLTHEKPSKN